jgi:multidrug efflux pump
LFVVPVAYTLIATARKKSGSEAHHAPTPPASQPQASE